MSASPDPRLLALHERIDAFFAAARAAQPAQVTCHAGCVACCQVDLAVSGVEAERLAGALAALDPATRRAARARAAVVRDVCPLLDPASGACVAYEARPLICRSQGLTLLADARLDHCPLTYGDEPARREHVLDLERVNAPLALINQMAGYEGGRIPLRVILDALDDEEEP